MENGVIHNNLTKSDAKIVIQLKYLGGFWRNLIIPLTNCRSRINFDLV